MTPIKHILFDYKISIFLIMKDSFEIINSQSELFDKNPNMSHKGNHCYKNADAHLRIKCFIVIPRLQSLAIHCLHAFVE